MAQIVLHMQKQNNITDTRRASSVDLLGELQRHKPRFRRIAIDRQQYSLNLGHTYPDSLGLRQLGRGAGSLYQRHSIVIHTRLIPVVASTNDRFRESKSWPLTTELGAQSCRCASFRRYGSFCKEQTLPVAAVNDRGWVESRPMKAALSAGRLDLSLARLIQKSRR